MRIALGCMRLSTDEGRDESRATSTVRAAFDAGVTIFDTARSYGWDDADAGHNEELLARSIPDPTRVSVVTKCGMQRPNGAWVPDGRANAILEDVRKSRAALGPLAIDVLLLHAIDPRTPLSTSVRALDRAREEGLVRGIGLSNVNRTQLESALAIAKIDVVQVALGAFDDASVRSGIVQLCAERQVTLLAHSPLGGPKKAPRLSRDRVLVPLAHDLGVTPIELFLAYLLSVHPAIVPLVGARRPETVASAMRASSIVLDEDVQRTLDARFVALGALRRPLRLPASSEGEPEREVALLMGLPGAGKSRATEQWIAKGYERLNRDTRGGTLRGLAKLLSQRLAEGATKIVLDNTYVTRASRAEVVLAAHGAGVPVRCVFHDTKIADAQVNVVLRMIGKHGRLLEPDELRQIAKRDPNMMGPTVLQRMLRELEPPSSDEGFSSIEVRPFVRDAPPTSIAGALVALDRAEELASLDLPEDAPCLLFAWNPRADEAWIARGHELAQELAHRHRRVVELSFCPHGEGPPICWCRPPLPGLWLAFAARHSIDPHRGVLVGSSPAHATMARMLGLELRRSS